MRILASQLTLARTKVNGVSRLMPEEEGIPNTRGSCTVDEAVAYLLGWLQAPISKRYIQVTEHGVTLDQLPFMTKLYDSIDQVLYELREAARSDFLMAAESDSDFATLAAKEAAVEEIDDLIGRAREFRLDIENAAYSADSPLVINRDISAKTGVTHFTLRSLDAWALKTYKRSLLSPQVDSSSAVPSGRSVASAPSVSHVEDDALPGIKERNLLVAFALLVEYISRDAPAYKNGDSPNAKNIAKLISGEAAKAFNGDTSRFTEEANRKRIQAAMAAKKKWIGEA